MLSSRSAEKLSVAGTVRGLIIAYGIGAYALISRNLGPGSQRDTVSFGESPLNLILIGLCVQAVRWVVMHAVARYEKTHDVEGAFSPTVMYGVDLVIDGVTVLLFAVATLRGISGVAASI
jgi:hypothetical protein